MSVRFGTQPPTPAEVAAATKVLTAADKKTAEKVTRAKTEQLKEYARKHMDAAARDEDLGSRGSLRMGYLKEFLVMRLKESGQLKRETVDEVHASDSRTETKFHEWTSGVMDREMTKEVAEEIRNPPRDDPMALKWRKCPYTGTEVDPFPRLDRARSQCAQVRDRHKLTSHQSGRRRKRRDGISVRHWQQGRR